MNDPTKNLPWRVENDNERCVWWVRDSTGFAVYAAHYTVGADQPVHRSDAHLFTRSQAEALARMVAAGSVAGELYAALKAVDDLAWRGIRDDVREKLSAALETAAPLLEPKGEQT